MMISKLCKWLTLTIFLFLIGAGCAPNITSNADAGREYCLEIMTQANALHVFHYNLMNILVGVGAIFALSTVFVSYIVEDKIRRAACVFALQILTGVVAAQHGNSSEIVVHARQLDVSAESIASQSSVTPDREIKSRCVEARKRLVKRLPIPQFDTSSNSGLLGDKKKPDEKKDDPGASSVVDPANSDGSVFVNGGGDDHDWFIKNLDKYDMGSVDGGTYIINLPSDALDENDMDQVGMQ